MAKRQRTGPAEDVMALFATLPSWAGVATAIVLYFVPHALAVHEVTAVLARLGQYLVPVLCLVGAGTSAVGRQSDPQSVGG